MSHEIESCAYAGEVPWHLLGKRVPNELSPEQMLEAAELNWTVEKVKSYANIQKNGCEQPVYTGKDALVRSSDGKILDVVSKDWNPVQNIEAFRFFDDFVHSGDMQMHTAGSLKGGQIVWALAKVNDSFDLFGGDKVDSYLLFSNPHKFGQTIDVRFTPIRVVCWNTLTLSLNRHAESMVKLNHRRKFDPDRVKEMLGIAHDKLMKYREMAKFLGETKYTVSSVHEYFGKVFPVATSLTESKKKESKSAEEAFGLLETQPGANFAEGSWWSAFNSVGYLIDHKIGRTADNRLSSSWFGVNRSLKTEALKLAVEYATAS